MKDFTPSDWMDGKDAKRQGRYTQFAMAATKMALDDAKLDTEAVDKVWSQKVSPTNSSGCWGTSCKYININIYMCYISIEGSICGIMSITIVVSCVSSTGAVDNVVPYTAAV